MARACARPRWTNGQPERRRTRRRRAGQPHGSASYSRTFRESVTGGWRRTGSTPPWSLPARQGCSRWRPRKDRCCRHGCASTSATRSRAARRHGGTSRSSTSTHSYRMSWHSTRRLSARTRPWNGLRGQPWAPDSRRSRKPGQRLLPHGRTPRSQSRRHRRGWPPRSRHRTNRWSPWPNRRHRHRSRHQSRRS